MHGLHLNRAGVIQQGGPQLVKVQYDGMASASWVQPDSLHVTADAPEGASLSAAWPREPLRRHEVPKQQLRAFLKQYAEDATHPTDLVLSQPGSDLSLKFALGEIPVQHAQGMYLNCLKSSAKAFNVTDSAALAAESQGIAMPASVPGASAEVGSTLQACAESCPWPSCVRH